MDTKFNIKMWSIILLFILMVIFIGVFVIQKSAIMQDSYDIKYRILNNSSLYYDVLYSEKIPNYTTVIKENLLLSCNYENINVNITSVPLETNQNNIYNITINPNGQIIGIESVSNNIPEITSGYPLKIIYPNESITKGYVWKEPINESIKNIYTEYDLVGENNYKCNNIENIRIGNETFKCAVIDINIDYTANIKNINNQGNVSTLVIYKANGTDWINVKNGFTIKEILDVNETYLSNLTDIYQKNGMINGDVFLKNSFDEHIIFELKEDN